MPIPFVFSAEDLHGGDQPKFQQIKVFFIFQVEIEKGRKGYLDVSPAF